MLLASLVALPSMISSPRAGERSRSPAPAFEAPGPGYSDAADVSELLREWAAQDPARVRSFDLARSREGRSVRGIEIRAAGWGSERDGTQSARRAAQARVRTVVLIGGLDGRSLGGSQAVLRSVHALLEGLDRMREDVAVVALPWASPDALQRALEGTDSSGRNSAMIDDDLDGRSGEDPPDDLDGDGQILEMLIEDRSGPWCLDDDGRTLRRAHEHDAPRYVRTREGQDDDGDGLFNEDGPTGVRLDAQFPVGWTSPGADGSRGARPLVEPVARALADWMIGRAPEIVIVFGGAHGGIDFPKVALETAQGRVIADNLRRTFRRISGRSGEPVFADDGWLESTDGSAGRSPSAPSGRAVDWIASVLGSTAIEVAAWGPGVVGIDGRPVRDGGREHPWNVWRDDVRAGAGFLDWHAVDLGHGRTGLVGGWRPHTRFAPPEDCLDHAIDTIPKFVQTVIEGLPRLDIEILESRREGRLVHVSARVVNRGEMPFVGSVTGRGVALELDLTCGAHLLVGRGRSTLSGMPAGGTSDVMRWVAVLEEGRALELRLVTDAGVTLVREVRL